jgi:NAD(P)H-hydrate epimerase
MICAGDLETIKMNKHEFQMLAKSFRAGRISLEQFTHEVFPQNLAETISSGDPPIENIPKLPVRPADAHKGDFGRLLLIGGSVGMAGAIGLSGMAALRAGAGLVKIVVPEKIQSTVASYSCCYMTVGLSEECGRNANGFDDRLREELAWANVLVFGPGMGRGAAVRDLVSAIYCDAVQAMVVDADALNALAESSFDLSNHAGPRILTPHPGEFQRLIKSTSSNRNELERSACRLAEQAHVVFLLKGHRTLVTDGTQSFHNTTGNPGMASGGTGDVLSGMIGALLGQGLSPLDAARLGAHWHGLAGDHAAESVGQHSLIATDIINALGSVSSQLQ